MPKEIIMTKGLEKSTENVFMMVVVSLLLYVRLKMHDKEDDENLMSWVENTNIG